MEKVAFFIGRFNPPHKGHIEAIMNLFKTCDRVVIGIGSCYEAGSARHSLPALIREKMLLLSLYNAGCDLSKVEFVHVQDFPTFEEWIRHVLTISKKKKVTHFVTGNQEDILNVLNEKNIALPFEFINPEETSSITWHASDLRKGVANGDYDTFIKIAASGTVTLMGSVNGFNGIKLALENNGTHFFGGRQTVDVVFTLQNRLFTKDGRAYDEKYLLCGTRSENKKDFPNYLGIPGGAIKKYESPTNAVLRCLNEKTGINVKLLDNKFEPAHILIPTGTGNIIGELKFLKLFSSNDHHLTGRYGGSSQCFQININTNPEIFTNIRDSKELKGVNFIPVYKALEQKLAYEQTAMVELAIQQMSLYDNTGYVRK